MSVNDLKKQVLDALRFHGQMSIQEILYLFFEDHKWIVKIVRELESKELFVKKIARSLKQLIKEGNVREYLCNSGYRRRYGIPELSISKKIPLKLKEIPIIKNCEECHFPIIIYKNKIRHFFPYLCNMRKNNDDLDLKILNGSNRRFVLYKSIFLGVLDNNIIRLPFKDNRNQIPEFFIAVTKYSNKYHKRDLTLKFKEVIV